MKLASILLFSLVLIFKSTELVEARSGCCSHHGGVCGCGCCDGTALSSTCAPYYPQCNAPVIIPKVVKTPTPSPKPTYIPKPSVKAIAPVSSPIVQGANSSETESDNWTTAVVASLVGAGAYHLFTKGKNNHS